MAPRKYKLGKRAESVEQTRRRIVDAVVSLHGEKGVIATSVQDIAHRADVAVGTVLRHFPSLDDLIRACGSRIIEITKPPKPEVFSGRDSVAERIEILVQELFAFYERAARWLQAGRSERDRVPLLDERLRHLEQGLESLVRECLGPAGSDDRVVLAAIALTDFPVWKALRGRGMTYGAAAALIGELLTSWVERITAREDERQGTETKHLTDQAKS